MKTFKEYINNNKIRFLDGPKSYAEMRQTKVNEGLLDFLKNKNKKEDDNYFNTRAYDKSFHENNGIKPQNLSADDKRSIRRYTQAASDSDYGHGSSENTNNLLRNMGGYKEYKVKGHSPKDVLKSVKNLSSVFTPENTNKKEIITYGGVPAKIGNALENSKPGDIHRFVGFTSTSGGHEDNEDPFNIANHFARKYKNKTNSPESHIVKYHIQPGTGLSVAANSAHPEEEVLLNHNAEVTYRHTENITDKYGDPVKVHHVTVHPTQPSLESYGKYEE